MEAYKHTMFISTIMIIILIVAVFLLFGPKDESYYINKMVNELNHYGILVDRIPIERVMVSIPKKFDDVYQNYNALQREAGFDLTGYAGKDVWRYTYRVRNLKAKGEVRANVLFYQTKIIGGDVMTTAMDGFMYPLNFKEKSMKK